MAPLRLAGLAAHFGRDLERCVARATGAVEEARRAGVQLLVLPDATLGGYLADLRSPDPDALPPALDPGCDELQRIAEAAGDMVVCVGWTERSGDLLYNAATCLSGDGVLGHHRKVHQPPGEALAYAAGDGFAVLGLPWLHT